MSFHHSPCVTLLLTGCMILTLHGVSCMASFLPYSSVQSVDEYMKQDEPDRVLSNQPNLLDLLGPYERKDSNDRQPYKIILINNQPSRSNDWIVDQLSSSGGRAYQGPGLRWQLHWPYQADGLKHYKNEEKDEAVYQPAQDDQANDEIRLPVRSGGGMEKRVAFSPWGGKRSDDGDMEQVDGAQSAASVRRPFNPWLGKRSDVMYNEELQ